MTGFVDSLVKVLAPAATGVIEALSDSLELDAQRQELAGAFAPFGPAGNFELVELAVNLDEGVAFQVWMVRVFLSRLKTLELVEGRSEIRASHNLFDAR